MLPASYTHTRSFVRLLFAMSVIAFGWIGLASNARADNGHVGEIVISPTASLSSVMCADQVAAACVIQAERTNKDQGMVPGTGKTKLDVSLDLCKSMYLTFLTRTLAEQRHRNLADLFVPATPVASLPMQATCRRIMTGAVVSFDAALHGMDQAFEVRRETERRVAAAQAASSAAMAAANTPPPPPHRTSVALTREEAAVLEKLQRELAAPAQTKTRGSRVGTAGRTANTTPTRHGSRAVQLAQNSSKKPQVRSNVGQTQATAVAVKPTRTARYDTTQVVVAHRVTTSAQLKCVPDHTELLFASADKLTFYVDKGAQTDELLNCLGPEFKRATKREYIESLPSVNTIPWYRQNGRIVLDPIRGNPAKALKSDLNGPPNKEFLDESDRKGAEIGFALQGRQRITFSANTKAKSVVSNVLSSDKSSTMIPPNKVSRRILANVASHDQSFAPGVSSSQVSLSSTTPSVPSYVNTAAPLGRAFLHDRTTRSEQVHRAALSPPILMIGAECTDPNDDACKGVTRVTSPPGN